MALFSPPTYEEGINTRERPLSFYRLTQSSSVVRKGGVLTAVKTPADTDLVGVEGTDWFIGGHIYNVSDVTATELTDAGFIVSISPPPPPPPPPVDGTHFTFGHGPFGHGPFGGS